MFDSLVDKMNAAFRKFRNKGKLTEADVKEGMREIKLALLEADVNYKVVREFTSKVTERAVGTDVLESLMPAQMIVKIVNEELTALMGSANEKLNFSNNGPTVIMMVGLQGAGKTTHCGKIAGMLKNKHKRRPLLVACDVYRPAAIKQLQVVGEQLDIPVFTMGDQVSPVEIAKAGVRHAIEHGHDVVFIDTAGRLHVDETMMDELVAIKEAVEPKEILLVIDAMLGQDAVNVAETFNDKLDLTGVVLTKLDGDTRGGAALSVRSVTGKPIKFVGIGEKLDAIEPFYPDRMASRILGMGDVLSLIEKAENAYDEKQAAELEEKLRKNVFTLDDFLDQFRQIKKMGNVEQLIGMVPGIDRSKLKDVKIDEKQMAHTEAVILSMTKKERAKPDILNAKRRQRIAAGAGVGVDEVNRVMKQYDQVCKMMKQFSGKNMKKFARKGMKFPF
ncbi:MAG: signal recognition particle protein [Lachnospiraceae bacterium]|nr:signal recognition particle protein [Lachnospiraceae bacterium]